MNILIFDQGMVLFLGTCENSKVDRNRLLKILVSEKSQKLCNPLYSRYP